MYVCTVNQEVKKWKLVVFKRLGDEENTKLHIIFMANFYSEKYDILKKKKVVLFCTQPLWKEENSRERQYS